MIIKNFLELVALTLNERKQLIRELMTEWRLTQTDVTPLSADDQKETIDTEHLQDVIIADPPKTETDDTPPVSETENPVSEAPVPKKRGRKKKTETPINVSENKNQTQEPSAPKRRGRPKKNTDTTSKQDDPRQIAVPTGKKRGRPKKIVSNATDADDMPTGGAMLSAEDSALIAQTAEIKNISDLLNEEPEIRSKGTRRRNPNFSYLADFPALKELTIGQEYPFEFLYQWKNKKLLSSRVLADLMPIGIYIPYQNIAFGKYRGFVVSIYDEAIITNANEAIEKAKGMEVIDGENWTIMDSLQWSVLKQYIGTVNRMLSRIGGDSLKKHYKTSSPQSIRICGMGDFRYTINVK